MELITALLGALIGLVLGTIGAGGSMVAVPALFFVVGLDTKESTTASLIIVGTIAPRGMVAHLRAGHVRVGSGLMFGITGLGGSFGGSYINRIIDPNILLLAFSVLMAVVAVSMLRRKSARADDDCADEVGLAASFRSWRGATKMLALGTAVGFMAGFFGVGDGMVVVPALSLAMGFSLHQEVPWEPVIYFTLAGLISVVVGSLVAGRVRSQLLAKGFGVVILLVAGYTPVQSIRAL